MASLSCPRLPRNLVREGVLAGAGCCPGASEPPTPGCRANGYLGVKDWRGLPPLPAPTPRRYGFHSVVKWVVSFPFLLIKELKPRRGSDLTKVTKLVSCRIETRPRVPDSQI